MRVDLFFGVIAGTHHRPGFDVAEAEGFAFYFPRFELVGMDPALDGEMIHRGLEILS